MSIEIDPANVTAVFALGQWHYVAAGSFWCDAYELVTSATPDESPDFICLGDFYPDEKKACIGASWEAQCGTQMAMPLFEIRAFKFEKTPS